MRTAVFDMDGTLLETNQSKSDAFYRAAMPYGVEAAQAMVAFHQQAGSVSRRARWEHFFANILKRKPEDGELESCMEECTRLVLTGALTAPLLPGVEQYLADLAAQGVERMVVSGVEEREVSRILEAHKLDVWFSRVWGGNKEELLRRLVSDGDIALPATYYGDTEDDWRAAVRANLRFVFVSGCSEWKDGASQMAHRNIRVIRDFQQRGMVAA